VSAGGGGPPNPPPPMRAAKGFGAGEPVPAAPPVVGAWPKAPNGFAPPAPPPPFIICIICCMASGFCIMRWTPSASGFAPPPCAPPNMPPKGFAAPCWGLEFESLVFCCCWPNGLAPAPPAKRLANGLGCAAPAAEGSVAPVVLGWLGVAVAPPPVAVALGCGVLSVAPGAGKLDPQLHTHHLWAEHHAARVLIPEHLLEHRVVADLSHVRTPISITIEELAIGFCIIMSTTAGLFMASFICDKNMGLSIISSMAS
jgi:hypothetical protein